MTMSEKDKNTLIIAAIALLIFGIAILGIKPAFASIKETKATNAELSAQKESMEAEINALPQYKTELENAKGEYAKTADRVFGDLTNDKIHDEVCALVAADGLAIKSMSISSVSEQSIAYYSVPTGDDANYAITGVTDGTINVANISISVSGSVANFKNFVEHLNTNEGTYLISTGFTGDDEVNTSVTFAMVLSDTFA